MGSIIQPINAAEQKEIEVIQTGENEYQVTDLDGSVSKLTYDKMSSTQHTVHVETEEGNYTINSDIRELTIENETTGEVQVTELSEGQPVAISASPRYNIPWETSWKTTYYTNSSYHTIVPGSNPEWTAPQKLHTVV